MRSSWNSTCGTWVGGKYSQHFAIPAPKIIISPTWPCSSRYYYRSSNIFLVWNTFVWQLTELLLYDLLQLVLPPWPFYRKHALDWQKPRPEKTNTKRGGKKKQKRWQENFHEGDTAWRNYPFGNLLSQFTALPTASAKQN